MVTLLHGGGVGSERCCQNFKSLLMHDERLFYLLSVKRLAPDHINPISTGLFHLVVALGGGDLFHHGP